jgi:hypothetical protein
MDELALASVMAALPPRTTSRRVIKRSFSTLTPPDDERATQGDARREWERHSRIAGGSGDRIEAMAGAYPSNRVQGACVV